MSRSVDERVVSMQFDNARFEKNVSTTMSTLDKLKQKLNFAGAAKGLDDVNSAAQKVNLNPMCNAAETVGLKFNAMYTIADQALRNITNAAMTAGKNIVSALTIDPVKTGLSEYETKINAIQVIKANTRGKNTMEDIEKALADLNDYADRTIYNYAQMTNNVGKFVAQGLDIKQATNAVMGMANLAGASGASAEDMARATYQMSQALGGVIRKIDWNSLRNANMAGVELKNVLTDLARVKGIDIDGMIEEKGTFEDTLEKGWLTGEMFTEAMNIYSDVYSEAELAAMGFKEEQISNFKDLAATAREATTEVKTLSQLWDVLKETAQSGWTQTWELIIGDFDTAKKMFTGIQVYFSNILNAMSDFRNAIIASALGRNLSALKEKLSSILDPTRDAIDSVTDAVKGVTRSLEEHHAVVRSVIRGDWGNMYKRWNALTAAGYDWVYVQNLVNERLGNSKRRTSEYTEYLKKHKDGKDGVTDANKDLVKSEAELLEYLCSLSDEELKLLGYTDEQIAALRELAAMADKLGLSIKYLVENIDDIDGRWLLIESVKNAWFALVDVLTVVKEAWNSVFPIKTAEEYGEILFDVIAAIHKFSTSLFMSEETADNLYRTFRGLFAAVDIVATILGGGLKIALKAVSALLSYFDLDILGLTAIIGDAIVGFRDWIDSILDFEGLFATIIPPIQNGITTFQNWIETLKSSENLPKDIADGIMGAFKKAFNFIKEVFSNIWDYISGGIQSIDTNPLSGFIDGLTNGARIAGQVISRIGKTIIAKVNEVLVEHGFNEIPVDMIRGFIKGIGDGIEKVKNILTNGASAAGQFISKIGKTILAKINEILVDHGFNEIPVDMIRGFIKGIGDGIKKVGSVLYNFATMIISKVCEVLGIESPSKVFMAIGGFIIAGLLAGLSAMFPEVESFFASIGDKIATVVNGETFGKVLSGILAVGMLVSLYKISDALSDLASPFDAIGEILDNVADVVKKFEGVLAAAKWMLYAEAIKSVAIAVAILVGSVIALTFVDQTKLWGAIGTVLAMAIIIAGMMGAMVALGKFGDAGAGDMAKVTLSLLGVSAAMLILATALNKINDLDVGKVTIVLIELAAIVALMGFIINTHGANNMNDLAILLLSLGGVLVIMSGVLKSTSKMDDAQLAKGLDGVRTMAQILVMTLIGIAGVMVALELVNKHCKTSASMAGIGLSLLGLAAVMISIVSVIKLMAGMSETELLTGVAGMIAIVVAIGLLMKAMQVTNTTGGAKGLAGTLFGIATAMLAFVAVAHLIARMDENAMIKGGIGIAVLGAGILLFMKFLKPLGQDQSLKGVGPTLLSVAAAIGILAGVAILLGLIDVWALVQGIVAVGLLGGLVAGIAYVTKFATDVKGTMIGLAIAIGILAASVAILSFIDSDSLWRSVGAMSALLFMLSGVIASTSNASKHIGSLIVLTVAVGLIGGLLIAMSMLETANALENAAAMSLILLAMSGAIGIMSMIPNIKSGFGSLILLAGVLAAVGLVLAMMTALGVQDAIANATALTILMGSLVITAAAMSTIGVASKNILRGALGLAALAGVMALLGLVLAMMSALNVKHGVRNALLISGLLVVLTGVATILAFIGTAAKSILMGALGLAALAGVMALIGLVLAMMSAFDIQNGIRNALLISGLLIVLTAVATVLAVIGWAAGGILLGSLGLVALVGVMALIGLVLAMMSALGVENAIPNAIALTLLIQALGDVAVKLALVAPLALVGIVALTALGALIVGFGALAIAVGAMMKKFPALEEFLDSGLAILDNMATGLGSVVGKFFSAFAGDTMSMLPELGAMLSEFMVNATPFIVGAKMVDEDVLAGAGILAGAIVALTAADLINGIASFVSGGSSFANLGTELSRFMINAASFINGSKMVDESVTAGVKNLAETILILTATDVIDSLTSWFTGGSSLEKFGAEISKFGPYMKLYADSVAELDEEALNAMKISAEAGKTLAEMAKTMPNTGGLLGDILGDNDIDTFGKQLEGFGKSLRAYGVAVCGIAEYVDDIEASVGASKGLVDLADNIPNSGGFLADFIGDNTMDGFGAQLKGFGASILEYGKSVATIGEYTSAIDASVVAAKGLTDLADAIPNSSGFISNFLGDNTMDKFGDELESFGESLMNYGKAVSKISDYTADIDASVIAAESLAELAEATKGISAWDLGKSEFVKFGENLAKFGKYMETYGTCINNIDTVKLTGSTTQLRNLFDLAKDASSVKFSGLASFGSALAELGETGISKFVGVFEGATERVTKAVGDMIGHAEKSATAKTESVKTTFAKVVTDAVAGLTSARLRFFMAGGYLVDGFAAGIGANAYKAKAKAAAMARAAEQAAKEELDEHSPSKVGYEIGDYFGIAFVNGIADNVSDAYDASANMADKAKKGLNLAISKINNVLEGNIDTSPVIRPVIDLTDVKAGVNSMGDMLNVGSSVKVLSGISTGVDANRQNGSNDEVVASINKLRKDIATMPRNTYSINGITYDDNSNVYNAIEEITRYALRERRT